MDSIYTLNQGLKSKPQSFKDSSLMQHIGFSIMQFGNDRFVVPWQMVEEEKKDFKEEKVCGNEHFDFY